MGRQQMAGRDSGAQDGGPRRDRYRPRVTAHRVRARSAVELARAAAQAALDETKKRDRLSVGPLHIGAMAVVGLIHRMMGVHGRRG